MSNIQVLNGVSEDGNGAVYEVILNDGGPDGGSNMTFSISVPLNQGISTTDVEAAVQAFSDQLTNSTSYYQRYLWKHVVVTSAL